MLILLTTAAVGTLLTLGGVIAWEARHPARRTLAWALANKLPADPGELGLPWREWSVTCPDGAAMPVWEISLARHRDGDHTQAEGRDRGPATLVLLHGWGRSRIDSLSRLAAILDALPDSFATALLPDLRGHGESPAQTSRLGDGEEQDLLALLDRVGPHPILLAGHSLGATIAIRAAASGHPAAASVTALIAWAPYEEVGVPITNRMRASGALARPFTDVALMLLRLSGITRPRTDAAARRLVEIPLLVIAGSEDVISPVAGCRTIAAAAPRSACVVLPGGHADMHRVEPAQHAAALRRFVSSVTYSGDIST
jgi:pimeloyl-ACP methyl ester carboxylesterase